MDYVTIRDAGPPDDLTIAQLHTVSWLNTYRGLLSDEYLDNNLKGERMAHWHGKLRRLTPAEFVLMAEINGELVGFVCLLDKPELGYEGFVDNLHVRPDLKGNGIGGRLLDAVAKRLLATGRTSYYLWVLGGNVAAETFYLAKGAKKMETREAIFGGKQVSETRFGWTDYSGAAKSGV